MGNYFQFIKNNTLSCFGNTMFQNVYTFIASNLPKKFLNTPNGDSNFSESVSLLIEEDDVPPGLLSDEEIKSILNQSSLTQDSVKNYETSNL